MESGRLALGTLATVGAGILAGLAVNPTMRTFPEFDWRARYRAATQSDPVLQPGVSYYGDGSVAWASGAVPEPYRAPPEWSAISWREPPAYVPAPLPPEPEPLPESLGADVDAEMAASRAIVAAAMARSRPAVPGPAATAAAAAAPAAASTSVAGEPDTVTAVSGDTETHPGEPLAGG